MAKSLRDDFGASGDGATDDTAAIQAAFDELTTTSAGIKGCLLHVPPGEYLLSDTVDISRFAGIVQGPGVGNTPSYDKSPNSAGLGAAFRWVGTTSGVPMFRLTDSRHVSFKDLRFVGSDTAVPSAGLNLHNGGDVSVGTNSNVLVEDCTFGVWPWGQDGEYTGRLSSGIRVDGVNADNDQFRVNRCSFRGRWAGDVGISLPNAQSLWGSITDCDFADLEAGISTVASTTIVNPQFNACHTDMALGSTARVDVFAWQSEKSGRLASLGPYASLRVVGGTCQINRSAMAPGSGALISAFPSDSGLTVSLTGMRFLWTTGYEDDASKPTISFGPSRPHACARSGFLVRVDDCIGLHASQCELRGSMWAVSPRSRGLVEWYSRTNDGIVQFRNELWQDPGPGMRDALDTEAWDQPVPGTTD